MMFLLLGVLYSFQVLTDIMNDVYCSRSILHFASFHSHYEWFFCLGVCYSCEFSQPLWMMFIVFRVFYSLRVFTAIIDDVFSLKTKYKHVCSHMYNSCKCFSWFQKWCCLDVLAYSSPLASLSLGTVPSLPTTIGITVSFIFHRSSFPLNDSEICLSFQILL